MTAKAKRELDEFNKKNYQRIVAFRSIQAKKKPVEADTEDVDLKIVMEIKPPKRQTRFKFCPRCSNLIVLNDKSDLPGFRLQCPTCPYNNPISKRLVYTKIIRKPEDGDSGIVDASKSDEHRQRTQVVCPECNHTEAFFYQMQTRSADEPMTNFYECTNKECKKNWRD